MMNASFMVEWLKIDGLYRIPRGLHVGVGVHTVLHYIGLLRHHRWLVVGTGGELSWLWLRRSGPTGGRIGNIDEVDEVKPVGLVFERRVRFMCGEHEVQLFAPRIEADRIVSFLSQP